jgi:hypothetical protein
MDSTLSLPVLNMPDRDSRATGSDASRRRNVESPGGVVAARPTAAVEMVDVPITGTIGEVARQLRAIDILLENDDMLERGKLGEGYHDNRPASETTGIAGTISGDVLTPAEPDLPIVVLSWVPEGRIDPRHRAFVRRHVVRLETRLGLAGPTPIRWFGPKVGEGDFWAPAHGDDYATAGIAPDDDIGGIALNKGFRGDALVGIIAHEMRHVQQAALRRQLDDRTWAEGDADDFAAAYLGSIEP